MTITSFLYFYLAQFIYSRCQDLRLLEHIGEGTEIDDPTIFPFFAQIQLPMYGQPDKTVYCGGSLVHPQWILTAAHCFPDNLKEINWILQQKADMVYMGTVKVFHRKFSKTNSFTEIHQHPRYSRISHKNNETFLRNNIAVAKLKRHYKLSATIKTISLFSLFSDCNLGTVIGVGSAVSENNNTRSHNKIISTQLIITKTEDFGPPLQFMPNTTFYTLTKIDKEKQFSNFAFKGSSGEPFVCEINFVIVQIGIFSQAGPGESDDIIINIYERVDLFTSFILTYVPHIEVHGKNLRRALFDEDNSAIILRKHEIIIYLICFMYLYLLS